LRFSAATHILRVNCAEMAGDGPRQPAYDILCQNHILTTYCENYNEQTAKALKV